MSKKLGSLLTLAIGGTSIFIGDYYTYSHYVVPLIQRTWHAEHSHIFAIKSARHGIVPRIPKDDDEVSSYLKTNLLGIDLNNPVGLAAGFDKDGEAVAGLSNFGFGFIEVGSVTPNPQRGNMYPRVFRLMEDRAIINRYGFNNLGHETMVNNLDRQSKAIKKNNIVVGVNLGKNRDTKDAIGDYVSGLQRFYNLDTVRYFVINISSPNTPNLRKMQDAKELTQLLDRVLREKSRLDSSSVKKPLLLKIAPDLTDEQLKDISSIVVRYSKSTNDRSAIDGLIISNTTVTRPSSLLSDPKLIYEEGGLSGPPLRQLSTNVIRKMYKLTNGSVPIIGVGGIESGADAFEKIIAGASAVQLLTSLTYFGPPIVKAVKTELALFLHYNGFRNIRDAIGAEHRPGGLSNKTIQLPPQWNVDSKKSNEFQTMHGK
ncbi:hypothetical protein RDWZM_003793 [Blomia tropicalis]|uniref:Dihydroorotate dehydrogenase (quinone), mitochondrial n=1 Tax=Blomia tropicalis TaxID=40697 RepID=A0A9Q0RR80_BLOTA|nr:hypothetical protein RDWZM_003793 [Blomia tropicalis]